MRDPETMRSPTIARAALLALCGYCLFIGFTALVVPHTFYADFPFLAHWVERLLVVAACAGFLTVSVPHLLFHIAHLDGFGAVDGAAEIAALASLLIPPCVALWATQGGDAASRAGS
jgi:hypothetical protein